jgi:hypothetical protein
VLDDNRVVFFLFFPVFASPSLTLLHIQGGNVSELSCSTGTSRNEFNLHEWGEVKNFQHSIHTYSVPSQKGKNEISTAGTMKKKCKSLNAVVSELIELCEKHTHLPVR